MNCAPVCPACYSTLIIPVPPPFCARCGQPLNPGIACLHCAHFPDGLIRIRAVGIYEGALKRAIHLLKYRDRPMLAPILGQAMAEFLSERSAVMNSLAFDAVVPVPLHKKRLHHRGYNQSERLALAVCSALELPMDRQAVCRTRQTQAQVGMARAARLSNLRGVFRADSKAVHGKSILLIDDVCTTGSTIAECAGALIAAGASRVYALTLAMG